MTDIYTANMRERTKEEEVLLSIVTRLKSEGMPITRLVVEGYLYHNNVGMLKHTRTLEVLNE